MTIAAKAVPTGAGAVNQDFALVVTNGQATASPATLTGISPGSGATTGGASVTLTGTNLPTTGAVVTFGMSQATVVSATATQIVVTAPAHGAGAVNVVVTSGGVASNSLSYTYGIVTPAPMPRLPAATPVPGTPPAPMPPARSPAIPPTGTVPAPLPQPRR